MIFTIERKIFLREYAEDLYTTLPYYLAKQIIEFPLQIIIASTTAIMVYFALGLLFVAANFFTFFFIIFSLVIAGSSMGYLLGTLFTQPNAANLVTAQILMPLGILAGFYSNINSVPVWFSWLQYVSPIRYALEAVVWNEFADFDDENGTIPNPIEYLNYRLGLWECIGCLWGLSVVFRIVSYFLFKRYAEANK